MSDKFILDNRKVVPADLETWARWFEQGPSLRRVAHDTINGARISTVFLGIDHGFGGRPLLFETMVFEGELDGVCERCETYEQAEAMHAEVCERVRATTTGESA